MSETIDSQTIEQIIPGTQPGVDDNTSNPVISLTDQNEHTILSVPVISQVQKQGALQRIAELSHQSATLATQGRSQEASASREGGADSTPSQDAANPRKRKYNKVLSKETHKAVWDRLKAVEFIFRISYLLELRPRNEEDLVEYYFGDVSGPSADFVKKYVHKRIVGISGTWQYRCLERLINFTREHTQEMPIFATFKTGEQLHTYLKTLYTHDLFVELFDFCNGHIDIAGSERDVHKWCRALFVELLTCAKKHVDWLQLGPSRPMETLADGTPVCNRAWLINRWKSIAGAKSWQKIRFDPKNVKRVPKALAKRYQPKKKPEFQSVDDDPETYIPSDTEE